MRKFCAASLVSLTLLAASVCAQRHDAGAEPEHAGFRCQTGQRLATTPDSALFYVAVSIPYDNLTFVRAEGGFAAKYETAISFHSEAGKLEAENASQSRVFTADYKETNSRTKNAVHFEEFSVPPGSFTVLVVLTDLESRRKHRWTGKVTAAPTDTLLSVSDLYWVPDDTAGAGLNMPRVVESFSVRDQPVTARLELYSAGELPIEVTWTLLGESGEQVAMERKNYTPSPGVQTLDFVVELSDLVVQNYRLVFEAVGNGRREERELKFAISIPGVPASIKDLGLAIRQLKYIASGEENRRLRGASLTDRERLFREFWKRRDPTPDTPRNELMEEYYFRVQTADERYSTHRPGWETDRGRIFILYGEPTDIERHPFEAGSRPYEIWFYHNLNRRFVFVDYTGFGDYTLSGPQWGY